jgi:dipeptidyl aminopeptidase/acylaminoacyl peptidase
MKKLIILLFLFMTYFSDAQENLTYQNPTKEILKLADVSLAPGVILNEAQTQMLLLFRDQYKSIEELSQEEMRLAGLRIDPKTNIGSRTYYYNNIQIKNISNSKNEPIQVDGLPSNPKLANFTWSPKQTKMACTNTTKNGVEVWVVDLNEAKASRLASENVNANMGDVINWLNEESMLVKIIPSDKKPLIDRKNDVPTGPTISTNDGKKAQNRTYQDLIKNPTDEHNFEQLAISEIHKISTDGTDEIWMKTKMYNSLTLSPDGKYVLVNTINKPFSYLVPYNRFPSTTAVYTNNGEFVETIVDVPLIEDLPQGFMAERKGRRDITWRNDKPSTLIYAEVLDEGDPEKEADFRDEVFQLEVPFKGEGKSLLKTKNRFSYILWGNDNVAIAFDYWWNTRNLKTYVFNPSNPSQSPKIIADRNYQDRYSDPGNFETKRNEFGKSVLALENDNAFLLGDGFSEKGQFPFLDKINLKTNKTQRVYQSKFTDKIEDLRGFDLKKNRLLVRIESKNEYPNYFFRNLKSQELTKLTAFENPFAAIEDVHKEVISYKREDGIDLSATLYLPVGYTKETAENLPMILWAYPQEFKDKSSAGQNTKNPNEFTYLFWGSPLYWLAKGYVVLDDAAFPIIGEGEAEPNDSFRKQLVDNAKAAIDAVDNLGYINRNKVAVGGHSYGAFMVANLLTHSDLFAAGIARSGAYNRTLTPFGFQSEERNYWEAPEVYYTMSPFMHADKMKSPLLLIHGEADNNSGTYPMQSERYFNALKGLGATVRLVMLPKESHGYAAKESIMHMLYEQDQWLEKYLKN